MNLDYRKLILVVAILLCLGFYLFGSSQENELEFISGSSTSELKSETSKQIIYVQISGAIDSPGLYQMNSGDRINDLIEKAGMRNYNRNCINLAQKLVDEQNLYIPKENELCVVSDDMLININNASVSELQSLTGIGEAKAAAIVEYRESNGTFETKEDLVNVEGISEKLLKSIEDSITLS